MQLHNLKRPLQLQRGAQRVGRGQASGRGKQSGRGGKGQTARAGHKVRPAMRDIIKKLPKRRGFGKNRGRTVDSSRPDSMAISLDRISTQFEEGAEVSRAALLERGMISVRKMRPAKIVGGKLDKKLSFKGVAISQSARTAIEKAGGTIT